VVSYRWSSTPSDMPAGHDPDLPDCKILSDHHGGGKPAYVLENGQIVIRGGGKKLLESSHIRKTYLGL